MSGYIKTGRGGAGNMIPQEELQKKKQEDLEAGTEANELVQEELESAPHEGTWRHMGRGGAGNWYTPGELKAQGKFVASPTPTAADPPTAAKTVDQRPWRGRGGAGNFMPEKPADPNQIELEERQKAKVVEESVRNEVQGTLKRPEGVHLAPTK